MNGNVLKLNAMTANMADRRKSQYGPEFRIETLLTADECKQALREIEVEIAAISGQIEVYDDEPRDEIAPETLRWLTAASSARAQRRRLLHQIDARRREIDGEPQTVRETPEMRAKRHADTQVRLETLKVAKSEQKAANSHAQVELQRAVAQRKREEHAMSMERIKASNSVERQRFAAVVKIIRERFGDDVMETIWAQVDEAQP